MALHRQPKATAKSNGQLQSQKDIQRHGCKTTKPVAKPSAPEPVAQKTQEFVRAVTRPEKEDDFLEEPELRGEREIPPAVTEDSTNEEIKEEIKWPPWIGGLIAAFLSL